MALLYKPGEPVEEVLSPTGTIFTWEELARLVAGPVSLIRSTDQQWVAYSTDHRIFNQPVTRLLNKTAVVINGPAVVLGASETVAMPPYRISRRSTTPLIEWSDEAKLAEEQARVKERRERGQ